MVKFFFSLFFKGQTTNCKSNFATHGKEPISVLNQMLLQINKKSQKYKRKMGKKYIYINGFQIYEKILSLLYNFKMQVKTALKVPFIFH